MLTDERILEIHIDTLEDKLLTYDERAILVGRAIEAELMVEAQEPVAWRTWEDHGNGLSFWTFKYDEQSLDDYDWEPLYTTPQPQPPRTIAPVQTAKKMPIPKPVGECNFAYWGLDSKGD